MTVFLSTHQVSVAEEMADRIGIFHQGQVIACGSADELRTRSQTTGSLEAAFLALTRGAQLPSEGT
jgi:ABC-2 type transport system ATP-binding protein